MSTLRDAMIPGPDPADPNVPIGAPGPTEPKPTRPGAPIGTFGSAGSGPGIMASRSVDIAPLRAEASDVYAA